MNQLKKWLAHFFLPGETNNFQAKTLHLDFLSVYLAIALILVSFAKTNLPAFNQVLGVATDISITRLTELTNAERQQHQLAPLTYNERLAEAARGKAQDMFAKNYWSHYAPDGTTPWDFILAAHYQYEYAGENLAKNFMFSQGVIDAWMNSPTHRENMLRPQYTEMGMAVMNGMLNGEETTLVVQMFGRPTTATTVVSSQSPEQSQPVVLAKHTTAAAPGNFLSFDLIIAFIVLLMTVLIADFYIAGKLKIVRLNGKNLAHFLFLGFVLAGLLLFITQGSISHYAAFIKPN
ncbi:CAP domain-containing protein [Patescibacteria group bacterium]|nr:CAP domain-containing protein [Patescibacteria group bacterium]MCL5091423.1 CAP domain-containing protein [Patescibacteria group bacterium]